MKHETWNMKLEISMQCLTLYKFDKGILEIAYSVTHAMKHEKQATSKEIKNR